MNGIWGVEKDNWYWFNRHKVFHAWEVMGATPKPLIAVVDSGFDTVVGSAIDMPQYEQGQAFDEVGNPIGTDVTNPPFHSESHGTRIAALIGSPANNGQGACGILPEAPIVPIKAATESSSLGDRFYVASLAAAIRYAYTRADTVNVSVQLVDGLPIVADPTLLAAVSEGGAAAATVVIAAGNNRLNLDGRLPGGDGGSIIVGGVERDSAMDWLGSISPGYKNAGTNYGKNVHLAASATNLSAPTYYPNNGIRYYHSNSLRGTSYATAFVSATAAMTRELLKLSRPGLPDIDQPAMVKNILWGSATIGATRSDASGQIQLGYALDEPCRSSGGALQRDLNVANAFVIAKNADSPTLVRLMNSDDKGEFSVNDAWGTYPVEGLSVDTIWDMRALGLTSSSMIAFRTENTGGVRAHGYQVWHYGALLHEHIGGAAERRAPWPTSTGDTTLLHGTVGEDLGATDTGFHFIRGYSAIP